MMRRITLGAVLALSFCSCVSDLDRDLHSDRPRLSDGGSDASDGGAPLVEDDGAVPPDDDCPTDTFGADCIPFRTCMPGMFLAQEGSASNDVECDGCPSGTFTDVVDSTECLSWTTCEPGQFVAQAGSDSRDQTCAVCPDGQTSATNNSGSCYSEGTCPNGTVEVVSAGEGEPSICEPCDAGFFCAGGSAKAHACTSGTWDHDGDPASNCVTQTTCAEGEYVADPGDATTDRSCEGCASGTFSLGVNADACAEHTDCPAGTLVASAGDSTRDRVCDACTPGSFSSDGTECVEWTVCQPGEYIEEAGSATTDQTCAMCPSGEFSAGENSGNCVPEGECPSGTRQTAPASDTSPPTCEECSAGQYCPGGETGAVDCPAGAWDHDGNASTPCVLHTQCLPGTRVSVVGSNLGDNVCMNCTTGTFSTGTNALNCQAFLECAPGTFVSMAGSPTTDVECSGCGSGSFSVAADATSCASWTDCQPGQYVSSAGTEASDRVCADCAANEYSNSMNAGACVLVGQCAQGTVEVTPATETSPPVCAACQAGTYCAGGQAVAMACDANSWDDDMDPATPCLAKTTCTAGKYVTAAGDATTNRSCGDCSAGEFSATINSSSCEAWRTCAAGTYIQSVGTSTSDRVCSTCPSGEFSSSTNASSCTAWTTCSAPSFRQSSAPSATADRQCEACMAPLQTSQDNETTCRVPAFQMSGGQVSMEAENYDANVTNGAVDSWSSVTVSGTSNGAVMAVGPVDDHTEWKTNITTTAPRLDYYVNFTTTGSFYVHVRGAGVNPAYEADSCWSGVNGSPIGAFFQFPEDGSYGWSSNAVTVGATGVQTVSVWAREDGFRVDKVVINTSSTAPTGNGPAQSTRN